MVDMIIYPMLSSGSTSCCSAIGLMLAQSICRQQEFSKMKAMSEYTVDADTLWTAFENRPDENKI